MITTIRKTIKQSTSRYIMIFLLVAILIGLIIPSALKTPGGQSSWVVRVNGKEISYQEFAQEVARQSQYIAYIRSQYGQYAEMIMNAMGFGSDPKSLAFDALVRDELITQYAYASGIRLSSEYIARCMSDASFAQKHLAGIIPPFVFDQSGLLNKEALGHFIKQQGMTVRAFEEKVEKALLMYHVINCALTAQYTPQFEIKQQFIATQLSKKFAIVRFGWDHFLAQAKKQEITPIELQSFFDQQNRQSNRYQVPEKRAGIVWKIEPKLYTMVISEAEIKDYYENNKVSQYVDQPVTIYVRKMTQDHIEPGHSLEQVRTALLENPSSSWASKWQKMDPIVRTKNSGALEKAAFLLQEEGEISPVVDTGEGDVILQLIRRSARTYKSLSAVKDEIVKIITQKKFKTEFVADFTSLLEKDSDQIEAFITEKKGKKEVVHNIERGENKLSQELFSLKKGHYAFYIENNSGVVIQLTDSASSYLPFLDSVRDVVLFDMQEEHARHAMHMMVDQALSAAEQSGTEEQDAQFWSQFDGKLSYTDMINPTDTKKIQDLEKNGLPIREFIGLEKEGSLVVHATDFDTLVVKLEEVEPFNQDLFEKTQKELKERVGATHIRSYLESFVASLHKNATIETNNAVFIPSEEYSE